MLNIETQDIAAFSSLWDGLNPHLIARFFPVKKNESGQWLPDLGAGVVAAPLLEADLDLQLNWQSPFEHAGAEAKAPMLLSMLQSGALQPTVDALMNATGQGGGKTENPIKNTLKRFEGRTGITKLNSTQVFSGLPPLKIQLTALFRAWRDAAAEVEAPVNQLMSWALPVELSADSSILGRAVNTAEGSSDFVEALMPSLAPVPIAMKYKNRLYSPMVIESIGVPLASPINKNGDFVELSVPMSLGSLNAIDRKDWAEFKSF